MKTHKTAVVIIPPQECWEPIQAIRRHYDRQVRRWMPHINLLYPFRPQARFDDVTPLVRQVCRGIEPFDVRLAEVRHLHHGGGRFTLWLAPEPREAVVQLQANLQAAVPDCDDVSRHAGGFSPHLSVGQVRGHEAMSAVMSELAAQWSPLGFPVRCVHLIQRLDPPDDVFRVDRSIPLCGC